jgi:hypothetical protein
VYGLVTIALALVIGLALAAGVALGDFIARPPPGTSCSRTRGPPRGALHFVSPEPALALRTQSYRGGRSAPLARTAGLQVGAVAAPGDQGRASRATATSDDHTRGHRGGEQHPGRGARSRLDCECYGRSQEFLQW